MNALQRDLKRLAARVEAAESPRAAASRYRLRCHIQPPCGWLNDPNGLCKIGEDYHVFYQYSPFDPEGGVKHWGHCRSRDLFHWEQLPILLYPDEPFDCHGAYSGSALYENGVLCLYYTGNVKHPGAFDYIHEGRGHNLCLATSRDGVTLDEKRCLMYNSDYPPDLTCHVRDPKVWKLGETYYMVLGARSLADQGLVLVYRSADKLHWEHCNTITTPAPFGYMWECPDLFRLGNQWFLLVSPQGAPSQNVYACGYFPIEGDWRGTCTLGSFHELDFGFDFYAPQTFEADSRRLLFGWMGMPDADYRNPTVADGWQHALTLPCELRAQNGRLLRTPAAELERFRGKAQPLRCGSPLHALLPAELCAAPTGSFALTVADGVEFRYEEAGRICTLRFLDAEQGCGRTVRSAVLDAPCRALRVVADTSSLEIFLNDGASVFTTRFYPAPGPVSLRLEGVGGTLYPLEF